MIIIDGAQYCLYNRSVFEEMRQGGLTIAHVTICYHENLREVLHNIGRFNQQFLENADLIMPVRTAADIDEAIATNRTGIVFGFQNPAPLEDDLSMIEIFAQLGVRFMQLTYNNQTSLASSCYEDEDSGIRRFGRTVIEEMNRVGMVIDMSHSGERSTLEAIEISERPITVSHANPISWQNVPRNKSDAVLKALAASGGMLGFSLYPIHLKEKGNCTLDSFCRMVARTAELMGVDHIGFGSDLVQGNPDSVVNWMRAGRWQRVYEVGEAATPQASWPEYQSWFRTTADWPNFIDGLAKVGFNKEEVAKIMGGNWHRFMLNGFTPA